MPLLTRDSRVTSKPEGLSRMAWLSAARRSSGGRGFAAAALVTASADAVCENGTELDRFALGGGG